MRPNPMHKVSNPCPTLADAVWTKVRPAVCKSYETNLYTVVRVLCWNVTLKVRWSFFDTGIMTVVMLWVLDFFRILRQFFRVLLLAVSFVFLQFKDADNLMLRFDDRDVNIESWGMLIVTAFPPQLLLLFSKFVETGVVIFLPRSNFWRSFAILCVVFPCSLSTFSVMRYVFKHNSCYWWYL